MGEPSEPQTHPKMPGSLIDVHTVIAACQHGRYSVVEEALKQGLSADSTDEDGCSLLHWAAINNRIDVVKLLLLFNADPNILGGILNSSPIHWAARNGHVTVCSLLVQAGAVCDFRDAQGYAPIHLAIQGSHIPLVAYLLLKFDYNRDIADNSGMTPAMWCAYRSFAMFPLKFIIKCGADLKLKEHFSNNTALHIAVHERNYSAVAELLEGGADVGIRNKQQETPLDIARTNKNPKILDAIEEAARKQGAIRTNCFRKLLIPPRITYLLFFSPAVVLFIIWQLFTHCPLIFATIVTLGFGVFSLITFRFDFNDKTYRLLPFGITITEAILMILSWSAYAHWYVPWWAQLLFVLSVLILSCSLLRICCMDPGIVKPPKDCYELYVKEADSGIQHQEKYCFSCFIRKFEHTKHCAVCDHCVNKFDHHCPWLHSCVTRRNMREFILFIISVASSSIIYCLATGHYALIEVGNHGMESFLEQRAFLLITIFLSAMHAVMLTVLFCVQINQISLDITTNARIKAHRHAHSNPSRREHDTVIHQPVSLSQRMHNLLEFCSSNGDPSW